MIDLNLNKKIAFVFDGTNTIGKEIINLFTEAGVEVLSLSKNESNNSHSYSLDHRTSANTFSMGSIDIMNNNSFVEIADFVMKEVGNIDIVVNNLEKKIDKDLLEISPEEWDEGLNINLHIPFLIMKMIVPLMKKNRDGVIINLSSINAINGGLGEVNYSALKSALESMNKALSRELGTYNIRVNSISYGDVYKSEQGDQQVSKSETLNRLVTSKEIANTVMFLSSSISSFINGQTILVDGGKTIS